MFCAIVVGVHDMKGDFSGKERKERIRGKFEPKQVALFYCLEIDKLSFVISNTFMDSFFLTMSVT